MHRTVTVNMFTLVAKAVCALACVCACSPVCIWKEKWSCNVSRVVMRNAGLVYLPPIRTIYYFTSFDAFMMSIFLVCFVTSVFF